MQHSGEGARSEQDIVRRIEALEREVAAEQALRRALEEHVARQQSQILDLTRTTRSILSSRIWRTLSAAGGTLLDIRSRLDASIRNMVARVGPRTNAEPSSVLISVLMPVYNTPECWLRASIESVLRQSYANWELCIADDASTQPQVRPVLTEYASLDARIRVLFRDRNGHIAAASNSCLEIARGEFIALLDHDDELAPDALAEVAAAFKRHPDTDMLYTDEDKIDELGARFDPFHKPGWSPEYLLGLMYTCHLGVFRTQLVREAGGFGSGKDGAQDYDLVLRLVSRNARVRHVPKILYHWRATESSTASGGEVKPYAHEASRAALRDYLTAMDVPGDVTPGPVYGTHRVRFQIPDRMSVGVVAYQSGGATVLESVNARARHNESDYLIFLRHDVKPISADWIGCLLEYCQLNGVGAVGPKLLRPDGRIYSAGIVFARGRLCHAYAGFDADDPGYYLSAQLARNCLAVSGACMMTKKKSFLETGGFDTTLPSDLSIVDYCLRLHGRGLRIVNTPYAKLTVDSAGTLAAASDEEKFYSRWANYIHHDPYHNPNLPSRFWQKRGELELETDWSRMQGNSG